MILCLYAFFLLAGPNCLAQDTLSFYDDFVDNHNNWMIADDAGIMSNITSGKYFYQNKEATGAKWTTKSIFLDPGKDFIIETMITQTAGVDNAGYGLVWGLGDGKDYYCFNVSSNGYFRVYEYTQGKYVEPQPWVKLPVVNGMNIPNKLTVETKNKIQTFYINDNKVFTAPYTVLKGAKLAFIIQNNMTIAVDYLKIKQDISTKINVVKNLSLGYKKENLGNNINSAYTEKSPLISPDGKTLFLVRENHPQNIQGSAPDDIWYSTLSADNTWQMLQNAGAPLNNLSANFVISITPDNNTLLLGNRYKADGTANGGGYSISHRTDSGWSMPKDVVMKNFINKHPYTTSYLANNGKAIILSVEADFTYGGSDLYVSSLQENGEWSEPKNLGPVINTFGSEYSPFLAADGVTMFYSTDGKRGYGSNDIFKTTRLDDTWTNWTEPENLGPEVNSPYWDAYYTMPASGEYALVASDENSLGGLDIFKIKVPEQSRPKPVVLIYGKVLDSKTKKPLEAHINYSDLKTDKEIGIANSSPNSGSYKIVLPAGQVYSFLAGKENYYAISQNIDLTTLTSYKEIEKDLYLSPIEVGATIRLNNIFFDTGKSVLKDESFPELERIIGFLQQNKQIEIELSGHTDNVGSDEANKKLSQDRASSVYSYLTSKGIITNRVHPVGYGKIKPVASNATAEGKQLNRRVEFTITKK